MTNKVAHYALDGTDQGILRSLASNARKSFREIAKEVGVALATVSARVRRLEMSGVIRGYAPVIDAERLGYELTVIIGVRIAHGRLMEVQHAIAEQAEVTAVFDVTGNFDSIVVAQFKGRADLDSFVKSMQAMRHVESTTTHLVLNTVKAVQGAPAALWVA